MVEVGGSQEELGPQVNCATDGETSELAPHQRSSGPDGFIHSETRLLNKTSLLPGPAQPSQALLGLNKPLQARAGSALHSSPWQVLASAPNSDQKLSAV